MRSRLILCAAAAALFGTSAMAATADFVRFAPPDGIHPDGKLICRPVSHDGMLLPKPVCMTERQWNYAQQKVANDIRFLQLNNDLQVGRHH